MLEPSTPHTTHSDGTRSQSEASNGTVIDQVVEQLAHSGMRIDRFVALATEGLLPDEDLRELWRQHRDVLVPDWAA